MTDDTSSGAGRAQPESFRGRSLSASLTATDLQKSLAWWRDVVGFHVDEEHVRDGRLAAASIVAGGVRLILSQDDGAKGLERKKGEGISLYVTTIQDVDELARHIQERGGVLDQEPTDMPWGARVFRLRDPDGFMLAISKEAS